MNPLPLLRGERQTEEGQTAWGLGEEALYTIKEKGEQ